MPPQRQVEAWIARRTISALSGFRRWAMRRGRSFRDRRIGRVASFKLPKVYLNHPPNQGTRTLAGASEEGRAATKQFDSYSTSSGLFSCKIVEEDHIELPVVHRRGVPPGTFVVIDVR
jgi:hypothetical protein